MTSTRYSCQILMKLEISRQIFEKSPNIKFYENPVSGSRVIACGQTDRQTKLSRYSLFAILRKRLKTCPNARLSTTNPTKNELRLNYGPPRWEASD
jgi:hypothetical protein